MHILSAVFAGVGMLAVTIGSSGAADLETLPGDDGRRPVAARACLDDLQGFDEQLADVGFGVLPPGGYGALEPSSGYYVWGVEGTPRQRMRALRNAAYVYAMAGDEQACQLVLGSMRSIYDRHQELVGTEFDDPTMRTAWRRAHLARAEPMSRMDHLVRADLILGSELRNPDDERLGEVADLVMGPGSSGIRYLLLSRGGFLGIGRDLVAVRWRDIRATSDHELFVLDVPPAVLDEAPRVGRRNFADTADAAWRRRLDEFWDEALRP